MKKTVLPPVYRDVRRLLVHTEAMVQQFSRYHKYTVGTDLRQQAMRMMRTVHRAAYERERLAEHVKNLVWSVDDYKLTLQLAMDVGAFRQGAKGQSHFKAFEAAVELAVVVGKQCGGWHQALNRTAASAGGSHEAGRMDKC
jgi:hypothetical protein